MGQAQAGPQATERAVAEAKISAMRARRISGEGQSEPCARCILGAGLIQPHERAESILAQLRDNARSIVIDVYIGRMRTVHKSDLCVGREFCRIGDQICHSALECQATAIDLNMIGSGYGNVRAKARGGVAQEFGKVKIARLIAFFAARPTSLDPSIPAASTQSSTRPLGGEP